jgi:hypothetical protein
MEPTTAKVTAVVETGRSKLLDLAGDLLGPDDLGLPHELVAAAKAKGIKVTWPDVYGLYSSAHLRANGSFVIPTFLTEFIGLYIKDRDVQSILDPCVGIGSLLLPIVQMSSISRAVGIGQNAREIQLAQTMATTSSVEWITEKPEAVLDKLGTFDLVVSSPAWGGPATTVRVETASGSTDVHDSEPDIAVLKAATHISDTGEAILVLPNSFFLSAKAASVRDALPKLGLSIHAIITLGAGSLSPFTAIETNLVFIARKRTTEVFVGRLDPERDSATLLENLKKRKPGAALELGCLVALEHYRGWYALQAKEEEERLARRSGLTRVRLNEIVAAVNLWKQMDDGGFANLPNCVYLPLIGTSPAVASLSDLRIKPHNYAQLVVKPDAARAEFLAGFFNSPLGRKTRESMLRGTFIPKLSKQTISEATLYTLPLPAQNEASAVGREIQDLRLRLEELERDLWNRPVDAGAVRKAMNSISQKEGFESWLETLPFPLAAILWRYQAAGSPEHKVAHVLNAFEAFAQFLGMLMASAFHSNDVFFREHRHDWFERGKDNPHSLSRSSFGEWVVRCQRLAKTTRQMLSDKDQRDLVMDLYRTDAAKIEGLANKGIYAVLESVGRYRNDWKGHTGIVGTKEHARRLALVQEELTRLRGLLGGVFEDWWLVRPGVSSYTGGIHHYTVEKLVGSRQIFKQEAIATTEVMDANELYCYDVVTRRPLQLLHFVRMLSAPESEEVACYFYNRLEKTGVRWVSYHFEKEAERIEPDSSVIKLINEVEEDGTA